MRNALDTLVGVLVGFIATFVLNALAGYIAQPRALVTTGVVTVDSKWYATLEIENYSEQTVNGLRIVIPGTSRMQDVAAVPPVAIKPIAGTSMNEFRRFELGLVEPRAITRILIPVESQAQAEMITVANAAERDVAFRSSQQIDSRAKNAIDFALRTSIIFALISGVAGWFLRKWLDKRSAQVAEYREAVARAEERVEKLEVEVKNVRRESELMLARVKVLLIARLADLAKELSFWRRTIRDLLLQHGADKRDIRELTDAVTRSLKTFWASRGEYEADLEALKIAAALVDKRG